MLRVLVALEGVGELQAICIVEIDLAVAVFTVLAADDEQLAWGVNVRHSSSDLHVRL